MSRAAGIATVTVVGAGTAAGVYAAVPDVTVLALWAMATGSVWWAVSRPVAPAPNPAPPPVPEGAENENTLVRTIRKDETHPTRHIVEWGGERDE